MKQYSYQPSIFSPFQISVYWSSRMPRRKNAYNPPRDAAGVALRIDDSIEHEIEGSEWVQDFFQTYGFMGICALSREEMNELFRAIRNLTDDEEPHDVKKGEGQKTAIGFILAVQAKLMKRASCYSFVDFVQKMPCDAWEGSEWSVVINSKYNTNMVILEMINWIHRKISIQL